MSRPADDSAPQDVRRLVDVLARGERGRLIARLVHRLGSQHLGLAEDVAQDALLAALSLWPYQGIPSNPAAWLTRVATNRSIDQLRRGSREGPYEPDRDARVAVLDGAALDGLIQDPELRLVFLSCHPVLDEMTRLALTLRVVSGFTAREIAGIFLVTEPAMAQRLSRGRRRLQSLGRDVGQLSGQADIGMRLEAALKVVYLMFCLGYAPRSGARLMRRDVAFEALRLARELARHAPTDSTAGRALAALLCFQVSRFDAREDANGLPVLLRDQDRSRWDYDLIREGIGHLAASAAGRQVSRYHLEAGVAAAYATSDSWENINWQFVLDGHARLQALVRSPIATVSACVAQANAGDPAAALARLERLVQEPVVADYAPYHLAMAEILRLLGDEDRARCSYAQAGRCDAARPVHQHIRARLAVDA